MSTTKDTENTKGDFPYVYRWGNNSQRIKFKGQRCRLIARGTMNSCLLEFADGRRMITSRNAIRKAKENEPPEKDIRGD